MVEMRNWFLMQKFKQISKHYLEHEVNNKIYLMNNHRTLYPLIGTRFDEFCDRRSFFDSVIPQIIETNLYD